MQHSASLKLGWYKIPQKRQFDCGVSTFKFLGWTKYKKTYITIPFFWIILLMHFCKYFYPFYPTVWKDLLNFWKFHSFVNCFVPSTFTWQCGSICVHMSKLNGQRIWCFTLVQLHMNSKNQPAQFYMSFPFP